MQLRAEQLAADLARGLKSIYTLHGDEPLLAQEAADALRAAARAQGFGERFVFTASGAHFDWSRVLGTAQSLGLFAGRRLIEIRIPSGKPGKEGSAALQEIARRSADDAVLFIIHLPRLDRQQQQSAWFTALEGAGLAVRIDPIDRHALPRWIVARLAAQGQRLQAGEAGEQALAFFANQVEGHLLAAHQEMQKIALLYPAGELTFEQIEAAVMDVARYDVYQLSAAALAGQTARALRILETLRAEGESAVFAHWTLAEDLRALYRLRGALDAGQPLPMALREARVWGEKERLFERLAPGLERAALAALVQSASLCDGLIKGLRHPDWPSDAWDALRHLVLLTLDLVAAPLAPRGTPQRTALALEGAPA